MSREEALLEILVPPNSLLNLRLVGYSGRKLPSWLMNIGNSLPNLYGLSFENMEGCKHLPPLGCLPDLSKLLIRNVPIKEAFTGESGDFRTVRHLTLDSLLELEEWPTKLPNSDEKLAFANLNELHVYNCPKLRFQPIFPMSRLCYIISSPHVLYPKPISSLPKLHVSELIIYQCDFESGTLPDIIRRMTSLQTLYIKFCNNLTVIPEWLGEVTSLRNLYISCCERLDILPPCVLELSSIECMYIESNNDKLVEQCSRCSKFKVGPSSPPQLRRFEQTIRRYDEKEGNLEDQIFTEMQGTIIFSFGSSCSSSPIISMLRILHSPEPPTVSDLWSMEGFNNLKKFSDLLTFLHSENGDISMNDANAIFSTVMYNDAFNDMLDIFKLLLLSLMLEEDNIGLDDDISESQFGNHRLKRQKKKEIFCEHRQTPDKDGMRAYGSDKGPDEVMMISKPFGTFWPNEANKDPHTQVRSADHWHNEGKTKFTAKEKGKGLMIESNKNQSGDITGLVHVGGFMRDARISGQRTASLANQIPPAFIIAPNPDLDEKPTIKPTFEASSINTAVLADPYVFEATISEDFARRLVLEKDDIASESTTDQQKRSPGSITNVKTIDNEGANTSDKAICTVAEESSTSDKMTGTEGSNFSQEFVFNFGTMHDKNGVPRFQKRRGRRVLKKK